jgi:hypothetical protein
VKSSSASLNNVLIILPHSCGLGHFTLSLGLPFLYLLIIGVIVPSPGRGGR